MAPLPEAAPGIARQVGLMGIDCGDHRPGTVQQQIELAPAARAATRLDDDAPPT